MRLFCWCKFSEDKPCGYGYMMSCKSEKWNLSMEYSLKCKHQQSMKHVKLTSMYMEIIYSDMMCFLSTYIFSIKNKFLLQFSFYS